MQYLLFSVLAVLAVGLFAAPQAFADHDEVTIQNAPSSSTPGCEDTADGMGDDGFMDGGGEGGFMDGGMDVGF